MKSKYCPDCKKPMRFMPEDSPLDDGEPNQPAEWWCTDHECGYTEVVEESELLTGDANAQTN